MISATQSILALALTILSSYSTEVSCLQCYQCLINPPPGQYYNNTKNLCVHFDYSDKFIVDCPFSTMCVKQDFHLELGGVKVKSVLRDCAMQKNEYHYFRNGKWFPKLEILEPYEEGCQVVDDKGERTTTYNRFCYCRKNLCNSSPTTNHEGYTDIMGVIVVFNLMKYINSLR